MPAFRKPSKSPSAQNAHQIVAAYKKTGARIETKGRVKLRTKEDLALYYTPGVGAASEHLAKHPQDARHLSIKRNSVAVISDGSAVLGLGNIGPYGALPVMEGKALIFKERANIDAWPIVLDTQNPDEIIAAIRAIAPGFGGINLEDIKAPECFGIERALIDALDIPVMHDDQHGTAIVVLAALMNAAVVVKKPFKKLKVVISGAGAAGSATARLLVSAGVKDVVVLDRTGTLYRTRPGIGGYKKELAALTNPRDVRGSFTDAFTNADVVIGLSGKGVLIPEHIRAMAASPIVFALANPEPEILPHEAYAAGAAVVGTGRSDFPNQINNALVFPGVFRGALDGGVQRITESTKLRAAKALASLVPHPTARKLLPDLFDSRVVPTIAKAVK